MATPKALRPRVPDWEYYYVPLYANRKEYQYTRYGAYDTNVPSVNITFSYIDELPIGSYVVDENGTTHVRADGFEECGEGVLTIICPWCRYDDTDDGPFYHHFSTHTYTYHSEQHETHCKRRFINKDNMHGYNVWVTALTHGARSLKRRNPRPAHTPGFNCSESDSDEDCKSSEVDNSYTTDSDPDRVN